MEPVVQPAITFLHVQCKKGRLVSIKRLGGLLCLDMKIK